MGYISAFAAVCLQPPFEEIDYGVCGDLNYDMPKAIFYLHQGNYTVPRLWLHTLFAEGLVLGFVELGGR